MFLGDLLLLFESLTDGLSMNIEQSDDYRRCRLVGLLRRSRFVQALPELASLRFFPYLFFP